MTSNDLDASSQPEAASGYSRLPDRPGCYLVTTTSGTQYIFNWTEFTVTRIPAPGASPSVNDGVRPLRTVDSYTVGEAGFRTMRSNDPDVDWYWQATNPIVSILQISIEQASDQTVGTETRQRPRTDETGD